MKNIITFIVLFIMCSLSAQTTINIGNKDFSDWSGILKVSKQQASFNSGDTISYTYPEGEPYFKGFKKYYGHASDWSYYAGITFEIYNKKESNTSLDVFLKVDKQDDDLLNPISKAKIEIAGKGWQKIFIPWELFDLSEGQRIGTLQGIKQLGIVAQADQNEVLQIRNVQISKGESVYVDTDIRGKGATAGNKVTYTLELGNTLPKRQNVQLMSSKYGWESMGVSIHPSTISLDPYQVKTIEVEVRIPASMPQGAREKQTIRAVANGKGSTAASVELTTVVSVPTPNIYFTKEKWDEVRQKIVDYDWAKVELEKYESKAQNWDVPKVSTGAPRQNPQLGQHLYHDSDGDKLLNCAIAYQLTGKKEYAQKCVTLLRYFIDPETGYPSTWRANSNNFVKEGGFFQNVARSYDLVRDAGLLTEEEHILVEETFRLYIRIALEGNALGGIGNWDLSEFAGAFYCALAIEDLYLAETILNAPAGIYQQLAQGVLNDGWWHECAVGYNLWCSRMFSQIAIALEPWGINFKDKLLPLGTTPNHSLAPRRNRPGLYGMNFMKWGAMENNSICIKDMWDAALKFLDYRGVMFAVNDATEAVVSGQDYELAYYLYRDPEYAAIINRGTTRDLLYGVPELPNAKSEKISKSAYADNMGIVQLRSQTEGREQREQIQAVLHYGTHGGGHGHYDRTQLISMMRYGRSFYNPEMYWYGYSSYLYKFLVQASINKNMVTVDQKMQEPSESFKKLFYTGDLMQATVVESNARWMNPPYGGMIYDGDKGKSLSQKVWDEGRSMYIPENAPEYASITDYTDSIMQRRLMVMMDDYIVLADYLKSDTLRTYDWLMQIKGFKGIEADDKAFLRHDNQMNTDPLGAAQFTTDCDWYKTTGTSRTSFEMCFGEGCDNAGARMPNSEDGPLKIDVFNAWPMQNEIMIGTAPETFPVNMQLWFTIKGDNETLVNDSTGAWILGSKNIDVDIRGKKHLELITKAHKPKANTIFWGNAKLVLRDGSEVFVSSLPVKYNNVLIPEQKGLDYYQGPVKIEGELQEQSTPGMPKDSKKPASISIDLSGLDAVAFKAKLGSDFPLGDESSRRKTMAVRTSGKETRYLSVIEPFENESVIKSVNAQSADKLIVELLDGRIQEITISNLNGDGTNVKVWVKEFVDGTLVREEKTN